MSSGQGWDIPEKFNEGTSWRWIHPVAGSKLVLGVVSSEVCWYVGHFVGGRMRRCEGEVCKYCSEEIGKQVRYILHVVEISTRAQGVWEFGPAPALKIKSFSEHTGFLKGMILEVGRVGKHKNARLDVELIKGKILPWLMSIKPYDLKIILDKTFERIKQD